MSDQVDLLDVDRVRVIQRLVDIARSYNKREERRISCVITARCVWFGSTTPYCSVVDGIR